MQQSNAMTAVGAATNQARTILKDYPFRRIIVVIVTLVGLGASAGSIQLLAGVATPPVSTLNPLGLPSWTLPAGRIVFALVRAKIELREILVSGPPIANTARLACDRICHCAEDLWPLLCSGSGC